MYHIGRHRVKISCHHVVLLIAVPVLSFFSIFGNIFGRLGVDYDIMNRSNPAAI